MFKEKDSMRPGATPERVLAICRLLEKKKYTVRELAIVCQMDDEPNVSEEAFRDSVKAAEDLKLIDKAEDGKYSFVAEKEIISSPTTFRRAVSPIIFANNKSLFFRMTEWFIKNDEKMLLLNSTADISAIASTDGVVVKENDVLGWRFWFRFLGIGYLYNQTMIPNMKVRLNDAMMRLEKGTRMTCTQFVSWLKENIPEASVACSNASLPLAVSNGLRILKNEGKIELISTMDAVKTSLYPVKGVEIQDFSEIIVEEIDT